MIDKATIQSAKDVDINLIVDYFGWQRDAQFRNMVKCPSPYHDERTASCSFNRGYNMFRCFGCGQNFDTISMYRNLSEKINGKEVPFPTAVKDILDIGGQSYMPAYTTAQNNTYSNHNSNNSNNSHNNNNSNYYYDTVLRNSRPLTGYDLNYLHNRGIILFDSYVYNGKVHTKQNIDKALAIETDQQKITQLNDIINKGEHYKGIANILKANRIQIKHNYHKNINNIIYLIDYDYSDDDELQELNRTFFEDTERHMIIKKSLDDNHEKRTLGESDFIFLTEGISTSDKDVYVCEGIEDSLTYTMNNKKSISLNSLSNLNSFIDFLEYQYSPLCGSLKERFVISFDHDKAGEKATQQLVSFFEEYNKNHKRKYKYGICNYSSEFHDINDYWKEKVLKRNK